MVIRVSIFAVISIESRPNMFLLQVRILIALIAIHGCCHIDAYLTSVVGLARCQVHNVIISIEDQAP